MGLKLSFRSDTQRLKANLTLLGLSSEPVTRRLKKIWSFELTLGSPFLYVTVRSANVYSSFTDLLQKEKKMIFWLFYVLNFFCIFIFL